MFVVQHMEFLWRLVMEHSATATKVSERATHWVSWLNWWTRKTFFQCTTYVIYVACLLQLFSVYVNIDRRMQAVQVPVIECAKTVYVITQRYWIRGFLEKFYLRELYGTTVTVYWNCIESWFTNDRVLRSNVYSCGVSQLPLERKVCEYLSNLLV